MATKTTTTRPTRKGREVQRLKKRLEAVANLAANAVCADCPQREPTWVSLLLASSGNAVASSSLAVLVCFQCHNLHCQLGEQVCQVKNIKLIDHWTEEDVETLELAGGNTKVNSIFEANLLPAMHNKRKVLQDAITDATVRQAFIQHKYVDQTYVDSKLYETHVQRVETGRANNTCKATSGRSTVKRGRSYDSSTAMPTEWQSLLASADAANSQSANAKHSRLADWSSDESDHGYSLPTHLGRLGAHTHQGRQRSARNLLKNKPKVKGARPHMSRAVSARAVCGNSLSSMPAADNSNNKGAYFSTLKTRRGRRKSSEVRPGRLGSPPNDRTMSSSTSTPSISRWSSASTRTNNSPESPSKSKKDFSWTANANKKTSNTPQTSKKLNDSFTDIAALREAAPQAHHGLMALRIPLRVVSDGSGEDSTRHDRLRLPQRVISDDSGEDSTRHDRAPLRMPRRVISEESGGDDTDRTDRSNQSPLNAPLLPSSAALLARRRSLPALALAKLVEEEEDSIRNQYGGVKNATFPVVRRQRTLDFKPKQDANLKPQPKYGLKLKYGWDSATDTDSERQQRKKEHKVPSQPPPQQSPSGIASLNNVAPTLAVFLKKQTIQVPNKILGSSGGGRSIHSKACSSDEDILGISPPKKLNIGRSRRNKESSNRPPRSGARMDKKGGLFNHLNSAKKLTPQLQTPMKRVLSLRGLQALDGIGEFSPSGLIFHCNDSTDDDLSFVRPRSRVISCGGLQNLSLALDPADDSSVSVFSHSHSSRGSNYVW